MLAAPYFYRLFLECFHKANILNQHLRLGLAQWMAWPSEDTFITNVLIDLPWLFIFQSPIKPLVWQRTMTLKTWQKYSTQIYPTAENLLFPCVSSHLCHHANNLSNLLCQREWPGIPLRNSSPKTEIWFAFLEANSNSCNVDASRYDTALQYTEACPGSHVHTPAPEGWWHIYNF